MRDQPGPVQSSGLVINPKGPPSQGLPSHSCAGRWFHEGTSAKGTLVGVAVHVARHTRTYLGAVPRVTPFTSTVDGFRHVHVDLGHDGICSETFPTRIAGSLPRRLPRPPPTLARASSCLLDLLQLCSCEHTFYRNAATPASIAATTAASSCTRTPSAATAPAMRTGRPSL